MNKRKLQKKKGAVSVLKMAFSQVIKMKRTKEWPPPLTDREKEILKFIVDGYRNEEVGERLGLSHKTVEAHRNRIMLKLNIHDITALVKYAIRTNITTVDYHRQD